MDITKLRITPEVVTLIAAIDEFKGAWKALQRLEPERLNRLRRVATVESIGSSTRIEGAALSDREVERLLSGAKVRLFRSRDEAEVAGYAEAMELVFESYADMAVTENHIKQLHQVLLKHSAKDERHRGEYKKHPNHVEAFDAKGRSHGIVFKTASPFDTPHMMQQLVAWFTEEHRAGRQHILILMAVFIMRFLAIHPFQDGNGRLSRIMTTWLLLRAGYLYTPFQSLERIIEENKERYYLALRRAQTDSRRILDWILFFLKALRQQTEGLQRKLDRERGVQSLPKLSLDILTLVADHGRMTVREVQRLTGANRNTIKAHLRELVRSRQLMQEGSGKGTWYHAFQIPPTPGRPNP